MSTRASRVGALAASYRWLFSGWRPRGHQRLGRLLGSIFPSLRTVPLPYEGGILFLDLRSMDHQHAFLLGHYPWEIEERRMASRLLRAGDVAFDVGANVGTHAVTFALAVGRLGRVVAYEPVPELLYRNVSLLPQVCVRPFAVAAREGLMPFHREISTSYSRLVPTALASPRDSLMVTVSLDDEASRLGVARLDLLKVDVEGSEAEVFAGAARLLSSVPRPILMFEWEPRFRARWTLGGAIRQLRASAGEGWRLFAMSAETGTITPLQGWAEPASSATIFGVPSEREYAISTLCAASELSS